ncbi:MAG: hypothetical protein CMH28_00350 [Micavibrio sp.]|mgnify:CR=1 FL=1|nr:hypothetical protein [Micavibrio sp.]
MSRQGLGSNTLNLVKLISFFKQLRHKDDLSQAGFYIVNELYNIIPYRQCVFWTYKDGKAKVRAASGQVDVSDDTLYAQFLGSSVENYLHEKHLDDQNKILAYDMEEGFAKAISVNINEFANTSPEEIKEWSSENIVFLLLHNNQELIGGLWIDREKPFSEVELALLEDIGDAFSDRIQHITRRDANFFRFVSFDKKSKWVMLAVIVLVCLWPVRFSISANSEIVPENMEVVAAPYNALIKDVLVRPNEAVEEGDTLFLLDETQLRNEFKLALGELESAREKLAKTERETFADPSKRSELNLLREQIKAKELQAAYAKERLELSNVKASRDGVLMFSDVNDLIGQPVRAGDRIMMVADPNNIELLIHIPTDNMINIDKSVPAKLFLNTSPLDSFRAKIHAISYQPSQDPGGILSYKARAEILNPEDIERIGLTGTAKVYGSRTIFLFNILRRPFIALRNLISL